MIERVSTAIVPTSWGEFVGVAYQRSVDDVEHVAFVLGDVDSSGAAGPPLVRVHSECLTGDVFRSSRCDCGPQLDESMLRIAAEGRGIVIYLRGHEGRGIGIGQKLAAYALQDDGLDTVDANVALGLPVDGRSYHDAALMLHDLEAKSVLLLTNNPEKCRSLERHGIDVVERVPIVIEPTSHSAAYLRTKRERMGHFG
jgi:3,4-dihydroxy 2-butanone 4-phosphate synthase/GTP cyclohydrolase II